MCLDTGCCGQTGGGDYSLVPRGRTRETVDGLVWALLSLLGLEGDKGTTGRNSSRFSVGEGHLKVM